MTKKKSPQNAISSLDWTGCHAFPRRRPIEVINQEQLEELEPLIRAPELSAVNEATCRGYHRNQIRNNKLAQA